MPAEPPHLVMPGAPGTDTSRAQGARSLDLMLSLGGLVGHLALDPAPDLFLDQLRERYEPFGIPPAATVRRAFSAKIAFSSAPPPATGGRLSAVTESPLTVRESEGALDISRWDFRAHLEPRGPRGRTVWSGTATCEMNPLSLDSLLRVLWSVFLPRAGGALVHACGLRVGHGAVIFPGVSGSGKSTLARKMPEADQVLSDEIVAVSQDELGRWRVSGTPFWGDFKRGGGCIRSWPLRGVSFLRQARRAAVRDIAQADAAKRLLECFLCFQTDLPTAARNLAVAVNLCTDLPASVALATRHTSTAVLFDKLERHLLDQPAKDRPPTLREVISEFRWVLRSHGQYAFAPRGTSMTPYLRSGDSLFVQATTEEQLAAGDIVLYWLPGPTPDDDKLTCHRLLASIQSRRGGARILTKGDSLSGIDRFENGRQAQVLGKVSGISRAGERIPVGGRLESLARLLGSLVAAPFLRAAGR